MGIVRSDISCTDEKVIAIAMRVDKAFRDYTTSSAIVNLAFAISNLCLSCGLTINMPLKLRNEFL